ncbi:transglutaminase family protein [Marinobacter caseinilyticus]|uniref:transglutaminase family protein n=1 Tax=Marinobacter caseinilyticus TaxID=2692195 RepID=UPI001407FD2D|nr:transglutaminase family protein [Marinobacter caseinilyticus]
MKLRIQHDTVYRYETPVQGGIQYIRLRPRNTAQQKILDWTLTTPGDVSQMTDGFGNQVTVMTLDEALSEITLTAEGTVELTGKPLALNDSAFPPQVLLRFTRLTEPDAELKAFAKQFSANKRSLLRMMKQICDRIAFTPGATTVTHTAAEAFQLNAGVCQDHTHIFIACCRYIGVPVRYVSGYVHSHDDQHIATHAWAEAFLGQNWHTFDVVNNLNVAESHIKLAVGLDYLDAAPVRGVRRGGGVEVLNTVARVSRMTDSQ